GAGGGEGAGVEEPVEGAVVVRRHHLVVLLGQRGRTEATGHRAAQRHRIGEGEARRELAGGLAAEIAVVLVASGNAGREPVAEIGLQANIGRIAVAVEMAGVLWCEALEALRTAVGVRARRAGRLVPLLASVFGAEGQRGRV